MRKPTPAQLAALEKGRGSGDKPRTDRLGRRRTPAQDEALRRINEARRLADRVPTKAVRFSLPPELVPLFESLNIGQRSLLLEMALEELEAGRWRFAVDED